jgi:hypothetical protein
LCLMVAHFEWPDILQPQKRDFFSGLDTDFRILMRTNAKYSTGKDGFRRSAVSIQAVIAAYVR